MAGDRLRYTDMEVLLTRPESPLPMNPFDDFIVENYTFLTTPHRPCTKHLFSPFSDRQRHDLPTVTNSRGNLKGTRGSPWLPAAPVSIESIWLS